MLRDPFAENIAEPLPVMLWRGGPGQCRRDLRPPGVRIFPPRAGAGAGRGRARGVKDGFLASVLADLQSPVQAIATWAAHLRQQVPIASEAAQALDAIEHNARAQDRIISSLLDLSRVAKGKPPAPRGPVDEPL